MSKHVIAVQKLCQHHSLARAFWQIAAQRLRDTPATSVRQTRTRLRQHNVAATSAEILALFREFEQLGLGRVVIGRGKTPTRFVWQQKLVPLARAVARTFPGTAWPAIPRSARAPSATPEQTCASLALPPSAQPNAQLGPTSLGEATASATPAAAPTPLEFAADGRLTAAHFTDGNLSHGHCTDACLTDLLGRATSSIWVLSHLPELAPPAVEYLTAVHPGGTLRSPRHCKFHLNG